MGVLLTGYLFHIFVGEALLQRRGGEERLHETCNSIRDPLFFFLSLGLWLIRAKEKKRVLFFSVMFFL